MWQLVVSVAEDAWFHGVDSNNGRHFYDNGCKRRHLDRYVRGRYHRAGLQWLRGLSAPDNGHVGNRSIQGASGVSASAPSPMPAWAAYSFKGVLALLIAWAHEPLHGIGFRYRLRWVVCRDRSVDARRRTGHYLDLVDPTRPAGWPLPARREIQPPGLFGNACPAAAE